MDPITRNVFLRTLRRIYISINLILINDSIVVFESKLFVSVISVSLAFQKFTVSMEKCCNLREF